MVVFLLSKGLLVKTHTSEFLAPVFYAFIEKNRNGKKKNDRDQLEVFIRVQIYFIHFVRRLTSRNVIYE